MSKIRQTIGSINYPKKMSKLYFIALFAILGVSLLLVGRAATNCSGVSVSPGTDLKSLASSKPGGTTFCLKKGLHRTGGVTAKAGMKFIGEDGAVVSGARLLNNWSSTGGRWVVGGQTQKSSPQTVCHKPELGCIEGSTGFHPNQNNEEVFINNKRLTAVKSLSAVGSGKFYFDYGANKIYIDDSPIGKTVETSVIEGFVAGKVKDVVVDNLVVEKYATFPGRGAIGGWNISTQRDKNSVYNWKITNITGRWNHGGAVALFPGDVLDGCLLYENGQLGAKGVGGAAGAKITVRNCEIRNNNNLRWRVGWEAGGLKIGQTAGGSLVENVWSHGNHGGGVWWDGTNKNAIIRSNLVENNSEEGIFYEISFTPKIYWNIVRNNGGSSGYQSKGIYLSNVQNAEVYENAVSGSENGIHIRNTGGRSPASANNTIRNNDISIPGNTGLNGSVGYRGAGAGSGDRFNNNKWRLNSSGASVFAWGSTSKGGVSKLMGSGNQVLSQGTPSLPSGAKAFNKGNFGAGGDSTPNPDPGPTPEPEPEPEPTPEPNPEPTPEPEPEPEPEPGNGEFETVYRVNAGGQAITGSPAWEEDSASKPSRYVSGVAAQTGTTSKSISLHSSVPSGTPASLFKSERWDGDSSSPMKYSFPAEVGKNYQIRLYFSENFSGAQTAGERLMGINIESKTVLSRYDTYAEVGGYKGQMKDFNVASNDKSLDIVLTSNGETPRIMGIEILVEASGDEEPEPQPTPEPEPEPTPEPEPEPKPEPTPAPSPGDEKTMYRINSGGPRLAGSPEWKPDNNTNPSQYVSGVGSNFGSTSRNISLHSSVPDGAPQALFQTERWDKDTARPIKYSFPVTARNKYKVRLYFSENFSPAQVVGGRKVDIVIEGKTVKSSYDTFAEVGAYTGQTKAYEVNASDASLDITLERPSGNSARIMGIEVINLDSTDTDEQPTPDPDPDTGPITPPDSPGTVYKDSDLNKDGQVNILDIYVFIVDYGKIGSDLGPSDINQDGMVDILDLSIMVQEFDA